MHSFRLACFVLCMGVCVNSAISNSQEKSTPGIPAGCKLLQSQKKLQCRAVGLTAIPNIRHLDKLEIADFSGNNITSITEKEGKEVRHVKNVYIDGNPLHCDCSLKWLRTMLLKKKYFKSKEPDKAVLCATPLHVKGRALKSLNDTDLCGCISEGKACRKNQACVKKGSSHSCVCKPGFKEFGKTCYDTDECKQESSCHNNTICKNTVGSYKCTCKPGYHGNSQQCGDIDECQNGNHNCTDKVTTTCKNTDGGFFCDCRNGFKKKGEKCVDIDECHMKKCGMGTTCKNTVGSFECVCAAGFIFSTSEKRCSDVDECVLGNHTCNNNTMDCHNTKGSYFCRCKNNFKRVEKDCVDIDECTTKVKDQQANCGYMKCHNLPGNYTCECDAGYKPDDIESKCKDVNECKSRLHNCSKHGHCQNTRGSYKCSCHKGFNGDGKTCTPSDLTRWLSPKYLAEDIKKGVWDRILALCAIIVIAVFLLDALVALGKKINNKLKQGAEARRQKREEEAMLKMDGQAEPFDPNQAFCLEEMCEYYPEEGYDPNQMYMAGQHMYDPENVMYGATSDEIYDPTQMYYEEEEEDVQGPFINEEGISSYDYAPDDYDPDDQAGSAPPY